MRRPVDAILSRQLDSGVPEWFRQSRPRPIRAAPLVQLLLELCNRFRQGGLLTSHDAVACLRLHHLISVGQRASRPLAGNSRKIAFVPLTRWSRREDAFTLRPRSGRRSIGPMADSGGVGWNV